MASSWFDWGPHEGSRGGMSGILQSTAGHIQRIIIVSFQGHVSGRMELSVILYLSRDLSSKSGMLWLGFHLDPEANLCWGPAGSDQIRKTLLVHGCWTGTVEQSSWSTCCPCSGDPLVLSLMTFWTPGRSPVGIAHWMTVIKPSFKLALNYWFFPPLLH